MSLCQYIGIIYDKAVSFTDNTTTAESPLLFYVDHQAALADRAEYQLLLKSTENEKYKTKLKRGEYMPELNAGVSAQYLDMMDNGGEGYGAVFGTVKIPISGLWEAPHTMKERRLMEEENRNSVKDSSEKLMLQMQQARNTLDESFQQVQLAEVAIRQAEENLKENHDNFVSGMINVSDMLDAQAQLQQSHDRYTDAITYYLTSRVNYLQVTGR
jgi:outer membrane protein TolC